MIPPLLLTFRFQQVPRVWNEIQMTTSCLRFIGAVLYATTSLTFSLLQVFHTCPDLKSNDNVLAHRVVHYVTTF